jgi:transcriptional regulator with XRE-family HTH domain
MPSALANLLREARLSEGCSLAVLAQDVGISFSLLGSIERGEAQPTLNVLWRLCHRLRLGEAVFLHGARLLDEANENRLDLRGLPETVRTAVIILLAERL